MNQSAASTVLYSGSASALDGKSLGSRPSATQRPNARRTAAPSAERPVARVRPGRAIIVSRPQSLNHG